MRVCGVQIRLCPVCGDGQTRILRRMNFVLPHGHSLTEGYDLRACLICGSVFADVLSDESFDEHYRNSSIYANPQTSSGSGNNPYDEARLRDTAECLSNLPIERMLPAIDIGTGTGGFLKALINFGWSSVIGVDPSPQCVSLMRDKGLNAVQGVLGSTCPILPQAGLVSLIHVLEHVVNPLKVLKQASMLLGVNGVLYIEVPDACAYGEHLVSPFQDINTEHINHFSRLTLITLARRAGLNVFASGDKKFRISSSACYPATWIAAKKSEQTNVTYILDDNLLSRMEHYLSLSQAMLNSFNHQLKRMITEAGDSGISIWGTGQLLMRLLTETVLKDAAIVCIVDGNPINHGKKICGITVQSPEVLSHYLQPILVTSTIHAQQIKFRLNNELKLNRQILLLQDL